MILEHEPGYSTWDPFERGWTFYRQSKTARISWSFHLFRFGTDWALMIPLWIPFALFAIPTLLLWWCDRRLPTDHCNQCGYNLTGNVTGICPECGCVIRARKPSSRILRRLSYKLFKWGGTIACVMVVVLFVISLAVRVRWHSGPAESECEITLSHGQIALDQEPAYRVGGWECERHSSFLVMPGWGFYANSSDGLYTVAIPLWALLIVFAVPTLLLWRHDRRKGARANASGRAEAPVTQLRDSV